MEEEEPEIPKPKVLLSGNTRQQEVFKESQIIFSLD